MASSEAMLVVVHDIVAGNPLNLNAGSLRIGGTSNGRKINYNGGGAVRVQIPPCPMARLRRCYNPPPHSWPARRPIMVSPYPAASLVRLSSK